MEEEKKIEVVYMYPHEINTNFGNPRKIKKAKKEELQRSLEQLGDFGCFIIDENNSVIAGNQRLSILKEQKEEEQKKVLCKKLIGYSEAEKRAINIKDNTHNGDWDYDLLSEWTADLNIELDIKDEDNPEEKEIAQMKLMPFEKYNYVLVVCRNELDYQRLQEKLGIGDNDKAKICEKKSIKARAVWFNDIQDKLK